MRKISYLLALVASIGYSQNYQSVEEVESECGQLGFMGDEQAEKIVDAIVDEIGVFRNFVIQQCPEINNAIAKNIVGPSGEKERYILYDNEFFNRIEEKANNDWAAVSILAHEIGHHLNGHSLSNKGSTIPWELEADYFSGRALAKMGATLEDAQSAIQTLTYTKATSTHPAKADRLVAIENGWNKVKGIDNQKTEEEIKAERAFDLYRKGEQAFQKQKFEEAITFFEKAKELGNVDAYYYLSYSNLWGLGVSMDYEKAYKLAKQGYEAGSIPSTYLVGFYLNEGIGVKMNEIGANRLFKKDFQAKWFKDQYRQYKSPIYASNVAIMYYAGYGGVEIDMENSLLWFKEAASKGELLAQFTLGSFYILGDGVEQDFEKAFSYLIKAADAGFAKAQYAIGGMYFQGFGVKQDQNNAIDWLKKAARQGDIESQQSLKSIGQSW